MRSCRAWLGGARGLASKAVFRAPHEGAERWGLNPGRLVLDVHSEEGRRGGMKGHDA